MNNLLARLGSAAVLIPVALAAIFYLDPLYFSSIISILAGLSCFEFLSISPAAIRNRRYFFAVFAVLLSFSVSYFNTYPWWTFGIIVGVVPITSLVLMLRFVKLEKAVISCFYSVYGIYYTGLLWGVIGLIFSGSTDGYLWIFSLLCGAFLGDTGAYAIGRIFGKKKLTPRISPGKTWAGAIGSVLGATIGFLFAKVVVFSSLSYTDILFLGPVLSICCQFGDLVESFFKRGFGVKDSGKLIPGHGGILDRCDSLIMGAPVLLLYIHISDIVF